jgi:hypothetical protein
VVARLRALPPVRLPRPIAEYLREEREARDNREDD